MGHFVLLGHTNRPLMPLDYYLSWCLIWPLHFLGKVCDPFSRHMLVWAFWLIWPKPTANVASHLSCNYRLNVPQSDNLDHWFCRSTLSMEDAWRFPWLEDLSSPASRRRKKNCTGPALLSSSIPQVHLSHILYLHLGPTYQWPESPSCGSYIKLQARLTGALPWLGL